MKRVILLVLVLLAFPSVALASYYSQALNNPSPLAPANKPFKNQPGYSKTTQFKNISDFNKDLARKAKSGYRYDSKRLASARATTNKKLANNLKTISKLQTDALKSIRAAADQRVSLLRDNLFRDYQAGFNKIKASYSNNLNKLAKKRNSSYQKAKSVALSKLKRAYTSSSQKKVRSRHQKTVAKIRRYYYLKVKELRNNTGNSSFRYMNRFKGQFTQVYLKVRSQASRSAETLNKRTAAQILILKKTKMEIAASLKRLSQRRSISLIDLSVKKASSNQAISSITYPNPPAVLGNWPDFNTPPRYLISKNYLPKNVKSFQNRQTKKICSLGSSYFNNLKKYRETEKKLKTLTKAIQDAKTNLNFLNKEYQKANRYYSEKKRIYEKEKKIRLERPDDSFFIRAKNRYLEARRALGSAKSALDFGKINLRDANKVYRVNKSRSQGYLASARQVRISQRRVIKKTELYKKAKRTCSKLVL